MSDNQNNNGFQDPWDEDDWTRDFKEPAVSEDPVTTEPAGSEAAPEQVAPEHLAEPTAEQAYGIQDPSQAPYEQPFNGQTYGQPYEQSYNQQSYEQYYGQNTQDPQSYQQQAADPQSYQQQAADQQSYQQQPYQQTYQQNYQQTYTAQPVQKPKKEKKERRPSFGKKLLAALVIAACFGVVAGCMFEAAVYFLGDRLGLHTADQLEAAVGLTEEPEEPEAPEEKPEQAVSEPEREAVLPQAGDVEVVEPAAPGGTSGVQAMDVTDVVEKAMPSIVAITNISTVEYNTFWGQTGTYESESAGSGIIISQDESYLYILTNNHVVEDTDSTTVQFVDGETAAAEIRGADEHRDIAVLEVALGDLSEATMKEIRLASIGDSTALKVGEPAIAIGNALGYGQSVTVGVISALDREVTADDNGKSISNNCIQTDAAINPGNSGGALLNAVGEVVGINEIKYSRTEIEGISYAIPIATAEPIIQRIINREEGIAAGESGFLGVVGIDVTAEISERYDMPTGVYVAQVVEGSPAEQAGIYAGDIITYVNGQTIETNEDLKDVISSYPPETEVELTIRRTEKGVYQESTIKVTLGARTD